MRTTANFLFQCFTGAVVFAWCLLSGAVACAGGAHPAVVTGIETHNLERGAVEILSTARASAAALEEGSFAMRQTTSCKAARDLLAAEMRAEKYRGAQPDFSKAEFFLIQDAEYCRIRWVYRSRP